MENSAELNFPLVVLDFIDGNKHFEFTYITIPGCFGYAFRISTVFNGILAIIALISIYLFRHKLELHKRNIQIAFGLISRRNSWKSNDRIFRQPAEVVDFIDIFIPILNYDYPVFNIADSGIFVGAICYMIIGFRESKMRLSRNAI